MASLISPELMAQMMLRQSMPTVLQMPQQAPVGPADNAGMFQRAQNLRMGRASAGQPTPQGGQPGNPGPLAEAVTRSRLMKAYGIDSADPQKKKEQPLNFNPQPAPAMGGIQPGQASIQRMTSGPGHENFQHTPRVFGAPQQQPQNDVVNAVLGWEKQNNNGQPDPELRAIAQQKGAAGVHGYTHQREVEAEQARQNAERNAAHQTDMKIRFLESQINKANGDKELVGPLQQQLDALLKPQATQNAGPVQGPRPPQQGDKVTPEIVQHFMQLAGGDQARAKQMAAQAGWGF